MADNIKMLGIEKCYRFAKLYYTDMPELGQCDYDCTMVKGHAIYEAISFAVEGKEIQISFTEDGCCVWFREFNEVRDRIRNDMISFHITGFPELPEEEESEPENESIRNTEAPKNPKEVSEFTIENCNLVFRNCPGEEFYEFMTMYYNLESKNLIIVCDSDQMDFNSEGLIKINPLSVKAECNLQQKLGEEV